MNKNPWLVAQNLKQKNIELQNENELLEQSANIKTLPRELLADYKYCMVCGTEATHPHNLELFNYGDEQFIYFRCTNCKGEMRHKRPPKRDKDKCKCGTKLKVRESRKKGTKHLRKEFYYTHTLWCKDCDKIYLDNKYKVTN